MFEQRSGAPCSYSSHCSVHQCLSKIVFSARAELGRGHAAVRKSSVSFVSAVTFYDFVVPSEVL